MRENRSEAGWSGVFFVGGTWRLGLAGLPVKEPKTYKNPVKEAMALQAELGSGGVKSRADLARKMGISRAKIIQMLNLLKLDCEIKEFMLHLNDDDDRLCVLTERRLRPLIRMDRRDQQRAFWKILLIGD